MSIIKNIFIKNPLTKEYDKREIGADAANIEYDNTNTKVDVDNVQDAIDYLNEDMGIVIHKADWDALSEEEKKTGNYYIDDWQAKGGSTGITADIVGFNGEGIEDMEDIDNVQDAIAFLRENGGSGATTIINIITESEDFFGQDISILTPEGKTIAARFDDSGKAQFKAKLLGEYTITCLDVEVKVNIETFGSVINTELANGDFKGWLKAGTITKTFNTLDEVLEDEKTLRELFTRHSSVDYLVDWLSKDEKSARTILENDLVAKWVNLRDYALDTLSANPVIKKIMDKTVTISDIAQVPKMTSATAPSGEVSSTPYLSGYNAYYAFDGSTSTHAIPQSAIGQDGYIQYKFTEPTVVKSFYIKMWTTNASSGGTVKILGSNDNFSFDSHILKDNITISTTENKTIYFDNNEEYLYYRLAFTNTASNWFRIQTLQFYADEYDTKYGYGEWVQIDGTWQPKGLVPVMTSNTVPYGEAKASTEYTSGEGAYGAFNDNVTNWYSARNVTNQWIQYKFVNPVCVKKVYLTSRDLSDAVKPSKAVLQVSNDGTTFNTIKEYDLSSFSGTYYYINDNINNNNYYLYYRWQFTNSAGSSTGIRLTKLQFYGRELKVSVPIMTSNTAPYGEVSASSVWNDNNSSYGAFHAFGSGGWISKDISNPKQWIQYKFIKPMTPKFLTFHCGGGAHSNTNLVKFKIQGSIDGQVWTDLTEEYSQQGRTTYTKELTENISEYQFFRMYQTDGTDGISASKFNIYGFDYSEKEFAEGSTMKYLYDHGIEFEDIVKIGIGEAYIEGNDYVIVNPSSTSTAGITGIRTENKLNTTNYNLYRATVGKYGTESSERPFMFGISEVSPGYNTPWISYQHDNVDMPKRYINTSSINGEYYLSVGMNQVTSGGKSSITEWWLE